MGNLAAFWSVRGTESDLGVQDGAGLFPIGCGENGFEFITHRYASGVVVYGAELFPSIWSASALAGEGFENGTGYGCGLADGPGDWTGVGPEWVPRF